MILEKVYDELMAQIEDLKKAIAGGSGGSKDYDKLDNRPKVNNITLTGNKKSSDLKIAYSMTEAEYVAATKNAESIYCLQENATAFEEEDETASNNIEWSASGSGYAATWVYAPSNQNFTGCSAVECDDATITVDSFSVVEGEVQVFLSCEDTSQIGETVTFTFTLTQPAGGSRIVKDGIEFGTDLYSETPVKVGTWIDGRPVYRQVVKSTLSTGGSAAFGGFYEATMDTSELHVDDLLSAYGYFDYISGGTNYRRSWFLYGVDESGDISVYSNSQRTNVSSTVVITYTRKDD